MELEEKKLLQDILALQLEDIMFHFDMLSIYALLPNFSRKVCKHRRYFEQASHCHSLFTIKIINEFQEMFVPSDLKRVTIIENEGALAPTVLTDSQGNSVSINSKNKEINILKVVPSTIIEQKALNKKMLEVWEDWALNKVKFYTDAIVQLKGHKALEHLLCYAKRELSTVQYCLEKA